MKIKISEITVPEGRRNLDPVKVTELAESIRIVGLLNPITISTDNALIAGATRFAACEMLGLDEIECNVFEGDELHIELAEIDENLIRNDLDAISIGELAIRRDKILEELGLRANQSNKGKSTGADSAPVKTTANLAKEAGVSKRVLQENKQLARGLVPEAKEAYRKKAIPKSVALKIARLNPVQQQDVVEKVEQGTNANAALPKPLKQPYSRTLVAEPDTEPVDNLVEDAPEGIVSAGHTEYVPDMSPVKNESPAKVPKIPSSLEDRLFSEFASALALPVDSQQRADALMTVVKTIIADCFTDKTRRTFLKRLKTVFTDWGVHVH